MTNLAALLETWQQWSAHDVLARAVGSASKSGSVCALDALRDSCELVELLSGWKWQAVHAARRDGASWEQIAATMHTAAEQARSEYGAVLDRQEQFLGRDVSVYREVL